MKDHSLFIEFSKDGKVSSKLSRIIKDFFLSYKEATHQAGLQPEESDRLFNKLIQLVNQSIQHPPKFGIFHSAIRKPFDYYQFGLDFIRPIVNIKKSAIIGDENLKKINEQILRGENVILLANHQTETDAQILSLLLTEYPRLAEQMIYVAGHRVIEDPLAIPLSTGCNLLCIYSKKHMDFPPEDKQKKVSHNQRTLKKMGELLEEGGKCIYIAPSGGRDRPDAEGNFQVAPFDPQSIEMLWLMANRTGTPVHFYPLALLTYHVLPPPDTVDYEIGERRIAKHSPVFLAFGDEIPMESLGADSADKKEKRNMRAHMIWKTVQEDYNRLLDRSKASH